MQNPIRGRVISVSSSKIEIQNLEGKHSVFIQSPCKAQPGDLVEAGTPNSEIRILTPNRHPLKQTTWMNRILNPRRQQAVAIRQNTESAIRDFFNSQAFTEVKTPILVPCPGMETHIRPFRIEGNAGYLHTSPEFAMKRLLVGGLEKIYQLSSVFRDEPNSTTHRPEFTMLEWYRAYSDYEQIMRDVEELFFAVANKIHGTCIISFEGKKIDLTPPWPRLRVRDLFLNLVKIDLVQSSGVEDLRKHCTRLKLSFQPGDTWDDLYFRIWLNEIEPKLPQDRAVFVTRYPASQSALAVIDTDPDGSRWARRFEVYAGGLELGNAFEELTDPVEQRRRFEADMDLRQQIYGSNFPKTPLDEEFLGALVEGLPPSGGIAIGVDRMVMLMANEPEIEYTRWI